MAGERKLHGQLGDDDEKDDSRHSRHMFTNGDNWDHFHLDSAGGSEEISGDAIGVSELFASYEEEFFQSLQQAHHGLDCIELAPNSQLGGAVVEALQQAETCILHMELDLQSIPQSASYRSLIRRYRSDLQKAKQRMTAVVDEAQARQQYQMKPVTPARSNKSPPSPPLASGVRGTLQYSFREAGRILQGATRDLDDSRRVAIDTEEVGLSVLGQLNHQRDSINLTRRKADYVHNDMLMSHKALREIRRRLLENRVTLCVVAILLVFAIVYLNTFVHNERSVVVEIETANSRPAGMSPVEDGDPSVVGGVRLPSTDVRHSPEEAFSKSKSGATDGAPTRKLNVNLNIGSLN